MSELLLVQFDIVVALVTEEVSFLPLKGLEGVAAATLLPARSSSSTSAAGKQDQSTH